MNRLSTLSAALTAVMAAGIVSAKSLDRDAIEATVRAINEKATIRSIQPTPVEGLAEVTADGSVVYISNDGKYVFSGVLLDVENRVNLTDAASSVVRVEALASVPVEQRIIYKPQGEVKHRVTVFTDISCGYCQQLHENIQAYLDAGIQVEYLAFPRGGVQSPAYAQMVQIWCAEDRKQALDQAVKGRPVTAVACEAPVNDHYELGDRMGVSGTPAIYDEYGNLLGGYVQPAAMVRKIEANAARAASRDNKIARR